DPITEDDLDGDLATAGVDGEDGVSEPETTLAHSMQPNSLGMSFVCAPDAQALHLTVRWGRYRREPGVGEEYTTKQGTQRRIWQRVPTDVTLPPIPLQAGRFTEVPDPEQNEVTVQGLVRRREDGWHVTVFLVNGQTEPKQNKDSAWIFQVEMDVTAPDGAAIFTSRPHHAVNGDPEMQGMAMRYRNTVEFAVGHGVGVHVDVDPERPHRAKRIAIATAPTFDVPQTAPFVPDGLETDMRALAALPDGGFGPALTPLVDAYDQWIDDLALRAASGQPDLDGYTDVAAGAVDHCRRTSARIRAGIELLDRDPVAATAFRFANRAMADQRVHSIHAENVRQDKESDVDAIDAVSANHTWRTFQLAFILLNLVGLTDVTHSERNELTDLLWFPTGGGKTEAYLGVAAYTMAIRRLQGAVGDYSGHAGVAVLMRYTLRLLTLQQFQRATALICACEIIRREDPATWGSEPFRIGLWVGMNSTPNSTEQADEAVKSLRNKNYYGGSTPHQLTNCPWCGTEIDPGKHIKVEPAKSGRGQTFIYCGDKYGRCPFSMKHRQGEGLPVLTVDEEIYRRLPTLLIATVDKFAQMPWNGRIAMLFGRVDGYCERHGYRSPEIDDAMSHPARPGLPKARTIAMKPLRPPDLIIQDELHLISGPLGTMVGLYETAVDKLATWVVDGQEVRPKVIASTATVRQAQSQVYNLFLRQLNIFPAQGLDVEDNFFAHQVPITEADFGRRYVGIYAPGVRHKSALIRVYTALLSAAQYLYDVEGYDSAVDPWMTLVGYFNSLRELGGMKRAVDDSVNTRLRRMERAKRLRMANRAISPYSVAELTSRRNATEIPAVLDQLEIPFNRQAIATARREKQRKFPVDVLLATNMISVGVDVSRFGLMVVAGQPKNTAEYIQATSRVGRRHPGLVLTVFNWSRPRDISHYERFEHYHATFYQQV
ncbi:MAG: DISARM system helicase DrmA, partial [Anaerolineales bacterium]|nr:DISARM system helicase DrmA [Anaerolineales bacterium]